MGVLMYRDKLTNEPIYQLNQYQFYKYNDNNYKLIYFKKPFRQSGYELESDKNRSKKGEVNEEKLDYNIRQSRENIFELALCNEWDYFVTMTIDQTKYKRDDLQTYYKGLSKYINNLNYQKGLNIKYLFIPELHDDYENWHIHGLISGLPYEYLREFTLKEKIPKYIKNKIKKGQHIYEWTSYHDKFGFNDIEPVVSHDRVSRYITKYITKQLSKCVKEVNAKMYYCSTGLNRKELIKKGNISIDFDTFPTFDYENEYVAIKNIKL